MGASLALAWWRLWAFLLFAVASALLGSVEEALVDEVSAPEPVADLASGEVVV